MYNFTLLGQQCCYEVTDGSTTGSVLSPPHPGAGTPDKVAGGITVNILLLLSIYIFIVLILSLPVPIAWWAHMRRFLSVRLSVRHWIM